MTRHAMPASDEELTALPPQLGALLDRAEIQDLLDRYVVGTDERRFDDAWLQSIFTDDVVVEFPVGSPGAEGLAAFTRQTMARWDRTLHLTSNHVIRLDGDRAAVRANLTATHVHRPDDPGTHFRIGGVIDGETVRTADGWRLRRLRLQLVVDRGRPTFRPRRRVLTSRARWSSSIAYSTRGGTCSWTVRTTMPSASSSRSC